MVQSLLVRFRVISKGKGESSGEAEFDSPAPIGRVGLREGSEPRGHETEKTYGGASSEPYSPARMLGMQMYLEEPPTMPEVFKEPESLRACLDE
jgi:hypothetical protein